MKTEKTSEEITILRLDSVDFSVAVDLFDINQLSGAVRVYND